MSTEILLPKLGFSMEKGVLAEWLVADGALVKEGEPLYSLESDKSAQEIPAPASGILKILMPPGQEYSVGTALGEIRNS
jgi:pyruvate/2-oxoglutarate dehydrogenase complex dihydrolipoamide acyltransferase (E2) component